jgi:acyl-CoA thioesterase-1
VIVAMGNSLSEGLGVDEAAAYPAVLEKLLGDAGHAYQVVNAGVSGETSSAARSRLDWVMKLNPDLVILETGANDGFRGIEPDLIRDNILFMVRAFKQRGVKVVLVGMKMVRNLGDDYTRRFAAVYPDVAARESIPLVPFMLEGVAGKPELNQADGIHPTAAGYRIVAETVYPYVVEAIKGTPQD